jgi:hypothetical protein
MFNLEIKSELRSGLRLENLARRLEKALYEITPCENTRHFAGALKTRRSLRCARRPFIFRKLLYALWMPLSIK